MGGSGRQNRWGSLVPRSGRCTSRAPRLGLSSQVSNDPFTGGSRVSKGVERKRSKILSLSIGYTQTPSPASTLAFTFPCLYPTSQPGCAFPCIHLSPLFLLPPTMGCHLPRASSLFPFSSPELHYHQTLTASYLPNFCPTFPRHGEAALFTAFPPPTSHVHPLPLLTHLQLPSGNPFQVTPAHSGFFVFGHAELSSSPHPLPCSYRGASLTLHCHFAQKPP